MSLDLSPFPLAPFPLDNLTHTLVGAALAEAGLKKRTALASAALMIGANFPDIDVAGLACPNSIDFRRGITHGLPAHVVLPFVLAGLLLLYDRWVRRRRNPSLEPADPRQLVLLSAVSIATHPALDFMNTYGMRWLMPVVNKWYYADALFIIDLWIWIALILAVVWARRARSARPARVALAGLALYVMAMLGITSAGRARVAGETGASHFMVAPTPLVPWRRDVVIERPGQYRFGMYTLFGGLMMSERTIAIGDADPAVARARAAPEVQGFLNWARFPFYRVSRDDGATVVRIVDARYGGEGSRGFATAEVRLP